MAEEKNAQKPVKKLVKGRHHSAIKAERKSKKLRLTNRKIKERISKLVKKIEEACTQKNADTAKKLLPQVFSCLDRATKKNIIHKSTVNRKKSRLSLQIDKIAKT